MSETEELIQKEVERQKKEIRVKKEEEQEEKWEQLINEIKGVRTEVAWLSAFLVKLPLFIGCIWLLMFATRDCNKETNVQPHNPNKVNMKGILSD